MLTLQQILESDSISSLVAKLNANFQTVAASNGGPQGIRGQQGIPGLPGKMGPTGPTGVTGPTGNIVGIIPFAAIPGTGPTAIGPSTTIVTPFGEVGPWPQSAWQWLQYYHQTGSAGDIFIDHANDGYWQYLTAVDVYGASSAGYTQGGFYSYQGTGAAYPYLGATGGWAGAGWYFYPVPDTSISSTVWVNDPSTYLISTGTGGYSGPYPQGPYQNSSPLTVNNARLVSKYGSIWVTSGSDSTNPSSFEDSDLTTSSIGKWGATAGILNYPNPGRLNSGIDRLLFKMSIDGLPYLTNVLARGYTGPLGPTATNAFPMSPPYLFPASSTGATPVGNQMIGESYWVKPSYGVSLENYTPLLFLSERKVDDPDSSLKFSSMGIYMFTQTDFPSTVNVDNSNNSLFLFTSRYSPDPTEMFFDYNNNITSNQTENWGEMILDFRRVIASNQYVCSLPADLRLSSDYRANPGSSASYEESNNDNVNTLNFAYRTYQGYISGINGKTLTGASTYADYWEFGLGDGAAGGPGGYTGGIHDASSGTAGMFTRKSWYGSSVLDIKPSEWETNSPDIETNNMVRVAGMMERGRRFTAAGTTAHFMSELIFYTSQFGVDTSNLVDGVGVTNDVVSPNNNEHKSLPSLYISPYRNIGIGTFVGNTNAANDLGPLEPSARFHVHAKENDRENDPTYTWIDLAAGSGASALLPTETFTVAAFSGDFGVASLKYNTDILIGNLYAQGSEYVNPTTGYGAGYSDVVNHMQDQSGITGNNFLRNAIRTESWQYSYINTLRFGAQPGAAYSGSDPVKNPIGKTSVDSYKNEFQISLHPITKLSSATDLEDSNKSISGVGIHNIYPRTRLHVFGKNLYNESEFGEELWTPGYTIAGGSASGISGTYPYYGTTAQNSPSTNQVAIDYIGDSYRYPVGIYDYQYFVIGLTANTNSSLGGTIYSPNAAVYPNREVLSPTRNFAPWTSALNNEAWPSTNLNVPLNGAYRHGGTANAWWEPTSYIGFNLFRDVSSADGYTGGDNRDNTRWLIGTDGSNGYDGGNNGGAAIISSPHGELGIITVPSGRDGGYAYEQWEQRGLGTRDVLNQMKIVFDKNGNIAVGNAAGWDFDAYSSLPLFSNGLVRYTPFAAGTKTTTPGTTAGDSNQYTASYYDLGNGQGAYGKVVYTGYTESSSSSPAAIINQFATEKEYIRLEVAAEKAWSRNGRSLVQNGYGYPANTTISIVNPVDYINFTAPITAINSWDITTDNEGRIISSIINYTGAGVSANDFLAIVYPHPTEFNDPFGPQAYGGFIAAAGALAAEWSGMNQDGVHGGSTMDLSTPGDAILVNTTDERGDANLRLNNFVYGEGFGISGQGATGGALQAGEGNRTYDIVKEHRQTSPKLIFTFLEKNPEISRTGSLLEPYKKVNTVIQSAQNESPLREYYIPKSDNTGGTFMVFTDHMGSREYSDGIDRQLTSGTGYTGGNGTGGTGATGNIQNLLLVEVVTAEVLYGHTGTSVSGASAKIVDKDDFEVGLSGGNISLGDPKGIGYVQYFNRYSQNNGETGSYINGVTNYFNSSECAEYGFVAPYSAAVNTLGWATNYNASQPISGTGSSNALSYNRAANKRNIDKYYKVYQGSRESYDTAMQANDWDSKATEIRFKRINSEFAFVDFNITVSVENPELRDGTLINNPDNLTNYIDCGVPRMTQALTFIYNPNEIESRNGFTEDEFGNGPYFHMWSGYRNWLPGSAVVGDDINRTPVSFGNPVGRSGYVDTPSFQGSITQQALTWNGNFLEAGVYEFDPIVGTNRLNTSSILAQGSTGALGGNPMSNIRGEYANNIMNAQQSNALFYRALDYDDTLAWSFMYHLPTYRGIWGGQVMSRTKNFSWRMVPTVWEDDNTTTLNWMNTSNNAIKLEIMFNEPIMHVATEFNEEMFGETVTNPYKYLTLSGQGIIQYSKSSRTNSDVTPPF